MILLLKVFWTKSCGEPQRTGNRRIAGFLMYVILILMIILTIDVGDAG